MARPDMAMVPPFYHRYIEQITEPNLLIALRRNTVDLMSSLKAIPEDKWTYRYAEGKWSIKEMVQHIADAERIFSYRALCFARGEQQRLPGFEENEYAAVSNADSRIKQELLTELGAVRQSVELLYQSFNEEQLQREGKANNSQISVAAIGFIIPGHAKHHLNILKERYL